MNLPTQEERFIALISENKKLIYKACHLYTRNKEDFKDLEQEITLQLWQAFPRYNPEYKISTWLYRIALNTAISHYRKERRIPHHNSLEEQMSEGQMFKGQMFELSIDADTEMQAEAESNIAALHAFIQNLGEMNRALMLLYLDGNSYGEIAEVLGVSQTNVATKISRIKILLKKHFSTF